MQNTAMTSEAVRAAARETERTVERLEAMLARTRRDVATWSGLHSLAASVEEQDGATEALSQYASESVALRERLGVLRELAATERAYAQAAEGLEQAWLDVHYVETESVLATARSQVERYSAAVREQGTRLRALREMEEEGTQG